MSRLIRPHDIHIYPQPCGVIGITWSDRPSGERFAHLERGGPAGAAEFVRILLESEPAPHVLTDEQRHAVSRIGARFEHLSSISIRLPTVDDLAVGPALDASDPRSPMAIVLVEHGDPVTEETLIYVASDGTEIDR